MSAKVTTILVAGAIVFGAVAATFLRKKPDPCPAFDHALVDSLKSENNRLRIDSALQSTHTRALMAEIEKTKREWRSVSNQVQDAYNHTRLLLPDSIARGMLADPPGFAE